MKKALAAEQAMPKLRTKKKVTLDDIQLLLLSLPTTIWYLLFCYVPMFGIMIAFKNYKVAAGKGFMYSLFVKSKWCGFDNFKFLFAGQKATTIVMFRNTVLYNVVFIILGIVVPVALAISISHLYSKKLAKLCQTAIFLPHFLSWVVVGYFVYAFLATYSVRGAMTAISSSSEHPVEAMKMINLMNSNAEYRTVARYGIEGKHYEVVSEGVVARTELGNQNMFLNAYGQGTYALGPVEASPFESVPADPEQWTKLVDRYEAEAIVSPIMGFTFDITPVSNECMAMANVWQQYIYELQTGTSNPDEVFPELRAALEAVGLQTVLDEAQSQLNAFLGK